MISQVTTIVSGPPASICIAPATVPHTSALPPSRQARCPSHTTQGSQLNVATWLGHIRKLSVKPLKEKITPASPAASRWLVQRWARKYMPSPPQNRCARQKNDRDHVKGSSR